MPSSPSTPQSATCPILPKRHLAYRQTDYFDGESVRITESRHRSHVMSSSASATSSRVSSSEPKATSSSSRPASTVSQASDVRPASPGLQPWHTDHVTPKLRRSKAKVTLIQAPIPVKLSTSHPMPQVRVAHVWTPPPTPKIERLPTPKLDDLPDRPFCDCCIDAHVVKYCASCGHELYRLEH